MESKWRLNEVLYGLSYYGFYYGTFSGPRPLYAQKDGMLWMNAYAGPLMGKINPYVFYITADERVVFGQVSTSYSYPDVHFPYGVPVEPDLPV